MANIKEAFQYAAQNPTSDFAKNLQQLASSGALDKEAQQNGIDLTPFKEVQSQDSGFKNKTGVLGDGKMSTQDLQKFGNYITSGTQESGKLIGESVNAPSATNKFADAVKIHTDVQNNLLKAIDSKKKLGQDTSKLEEALRQHTESTPKQEQFTGDVLNTTPEQLGKTMGGLLVEAGGGAGIEAGTKIASEGTKIIKPIMNDIVKPVVKDVVKPIEKIAEKQAIKKSLNAIKSTENIMTVAEKEAAINEGRVKATTLGGKEYLPSKIEERAAELLKGKMESNPAKNVPIVKKEISKLGKEAETYLEANKKPITAQEQSDMFSKAREARAKYSTDTEMNAYDEQMRLFLKQLPGKGGYTTDNFYKALKEYEANVAEHLPRGGEALRDPTGVASAKIHAASDIRTIVRDAIGNKHPEFKQKMFDLASLYEAKGNLIAKTRKLTGNVITRTLNKPIVKYGVGGTALFEGAKKLTGN